MAGEVASLVLSRMTVPVVYFLMRRREDRRALRQAVSAAPTARAPEPLTYAA